MSSLNYEKAMVNAKQTIKCRQHRHLTPIGKITIIKTLVLSKFIHLFISLLTPTEYIDAINKLLFDYIWNGKPDKINRQQICKKTSVGLGMINVYNFERTLKIKWLMHFISGQETDWQTLLCHDIKGLKRLFILGGEWSNLQISSLNPFWKTVFTYFKELCRDVKVQTNQDIFSSSLWFNTHIGTDKLFFPDWFKHGIHIVGDTINVNGNILSLLEVKNRYNFLVTFLTTSQLKR